MVNAQGGQACLAQARQDRPGIGELDLTEELIEKPDRSQQGPNRKYLNPRTYIEMNAMIKAYQVYFSLPTIPQKGRDIEIILAHRG